jgi:hypothetical protein
MNNAYWLTMILLVALFALGLYLSRKDHREE